MFFAIERIANEAIDASIDFSFWVFQIAAQQEHGKDKKDEPDHSDLLNL